MKELSSLIRSLVRPFIIVWGCVIYGMCILLKMEVPSLLGGLITAVVLEYFSERAIKRFQEKD